MPQVRLTDLAIRSIKPPDTGQMTYTDKNLKGFGVRVSQGGSMTFLVVLGANRRKITIGRYPIIKLSDARTEAKRIIAEHTLGKNRPRSVTFEHARNSFLDACRQKNRPRTVKDYERLLSRHFRFSRVHLADITTDEINSRVARLKDTPSEQNHAFVAIRVFLRWCVRNHYLDRSPLEAQQLPARTRSRERVLNADELGAVYRKALAYPFPYGSIVSLLILTGQRRGEIGALQWSWIKEDTITLPGSITKNKRTHTFPLGSLAKSIVEAIPETGPYLFPAARSHIRGKRTTHFNG